MYFGFRWQSKNRNTEKLDEGKCAPARKSSTKERCAELNFTNVTSITKMQGRDLTYSFV